MRRRLTVAIGGGLVLLFAVLQVSRAAIKSFDSDVGHELAVRLAEGATGHLSFTIKDQAGVATGVDQVDWRVYGGDGFGTLLYTGPAITTGSAQIELVLPVQAQRILSPTSGADERRRVALLLTKGSDTGRDWIEYSVQNDPTVKVVEPTPGVWQTQFE